VRQNAVMVTPEVLVIGAGPAGLTAAARLAGHHHRQVLVLDREEQAGGIPRHSDHTGYGLRDLGRLLRGPAYAGRLVAAAQLAGATIQPGAMVTGWDADGGALVTSPQGRMTVHPKAVVLATGARERPRTARLIPGDRPAGVYTTGELQNLVHLHHRAPGRRVVVVGGEPVSWSAVLTLRDAGARTVLMTTEYRSPESYAAFNLGGQLALRVPVATRTRVARITGRPRVEAVEIEHLDGGARRMIGCDAVVFTGDWVPDHELARLAGIELDPGTRGPLVDTALRTSRPGCSPPGTCCIRWTPRTSRRWMAGTSLNRSRRGWRASVPIRTRCASARRSRCGGSPRGCCGPVTRPRPGGGCCCGPTNSSGCQS
jgi:thioredoxin reductase